MGTLLPGEHQQFGVDEQQLGGGFLEATTRLDPMTNGVDPLGGDSLDALLATSHESQSPEGMAIADGAMTGGLSAATVRKRQRARKSVVWEMEAGQQKAGATAKPRGV